MSSGFFTELISPTTAKWKAEALAQGWEWLERIGVNGNYSRYRHIECDHEQDVSMGNMRKGEVKCRGCMTPGWKSDAQKQGWTWLSQTGVAHSRYRHIECDHEQDAQMGAMRRGNVKCRGCTETGWKSDAQKQGWTWLSQIDGFRSRYKHHCGHEQDARMGHMHIGKVACRGCMKTGWKSDAQKQGWEWLEQIGVDGQYSRYKHHCDHEQDARMSAMRIGNVACHGCGESWATKPSNLYLLSIHIADGPKFLKLGIARDVDRRAAKYGLPEHAEVSIVHACAYKTGKEALKLEKAVHKTIVGWPQVNRFDASAWMESGSTECYAWSAESQAILEMSMPRNPQ